MLIANPIYDTVFGYLMKDLEIAKGIISTIIGEDIEQLDLKPQENILKKDKGGFLLISFHQDFIARIRQKNGSYKTVLIELQKTNIDYDIMRFRKYLGGEYRREDEIITSDGSVATEPLPIVTIYFLGFYLSKTLPAVIKVNREYIDLLDGKKIDERDELIECLNHDSFVIQVPALHLHLSNRLEYVLSIFIQENFINEERRLKDYAHETDDPLLEKILQRLGKAAADRDLHRQMELEKMAEHEYEAGLRRETKKLEVKLQKQEELLKELEEALESKDKLIEEKDKALEEKDKAVEALRDQKQYYEDLLKKLGHQI
ncbi:MAG: hypothetical protein ACM3SY_17725 [Candidatus Omnitrophota bacterium]